MQCRNNPNALFANTGKSGWNIAPGRLHTSGDTMEYEIDVPKAGEWTVWLRYATEMSPWNQPGVSENMVLIIDESEPIPLENLPNTGSFGTFKWSRSAQVKLTKGRHRLVWRNVEGGGISLDAFVFAFPSEFEPSDKPFPTSSDSVVVVQGEDVIRFETKEGVLPGRQRTAIWLKGNHSGIRDLTVEGVPVIDTGVLIRHQDFPRWISDCIVENVGITGVEGKRAENRAVHLCYALRAKVQNCELWARAPVFLSGARQCIISDNQLVCQTRFGGNANGAIIGRTNIVSECVIENNLIACPPGADQSVIQDTLDACTQDNVLQMESVLEQLFHQYSLSIKELKQSLKEQKITTVDLDLSAQPASKNAEGSSKGYFSKKRNTYGRQLARIIFPSTSEIVSVQPSKGLDTLKDFILATLYRVKFSKKWSAKWNEGKCLETKEQRNLIRLRIDAGFGTDENINYALWSGYEVLGKRRKGKRARKLALSVKEWIDARLLKNRKKTINQLLDRLDG